MIAPADVIAAACLHSGSNTLGSPALAVAIARLFGPQPSLCLCARSQNVSQNKLPREACLSHAKGVPAQAQHRQCGLSLQILQMLPLHQLPQLHQEAFWLPICLSQMISMFGPIVKVCGKSSQTSLHKMSTMQARFGRALFVVSAPHDSASRCHCSSLLGFWLQFFGQSCACSSHGLCCWTSTQSDLVRADAACLTEQLTSCSMPLTYKVCVCAGKTSESWVAWAARSLEGMLFVICGKVGPASVAQYLTAG